MMACISVTVRTRGSFFGAFTAIARRDCGLPLTDVVQERLPPPPAAG